VVAARIFLTLFLCPALAANVFGQGTTTDQKVGEQSVEAATVNGEDQTAIEREKEFNDAKVFNLPEIDLRVTVLDKDYILDLGDLIGNRKYRFKLNLENATDQPIVLNEVKTSCGCMVGVIPNETLRHGDKGDVRILVSAPGKVSQYGVKVLLFDKDLDSLPVRLFVKANICSPVNFEPKETLKFEVDSNRNSETRIRLTPRSSEIAILPKKVKTFGRAELIHMNLLEPGLELKFDALELSASDFNLVQKLLVVYADERVPGIDFEWSQELPIEIEGIAAIFPKEVSLSETDETISGRFILVGSKEEMTVDGTMADFYITVDDAMIKCESSPLGPTKWLVRFVAPKEGGFAVAGDSKPIEGEFNASAIQLPIRLSRGL
jgi:Protein of unknown function (DUF1573)